MAGQRRPCWGTAATGILSRRLAWAILSYTTKARRTWKGSKMKAFVPANDPDKDFVITMKPHHKAAIDMARAFLKCGKNSMLRKMTQGMVRDQGNTKR
jgi:uncharacterized protein (DUF305 family)